MLSRHRDVITVAPAVSQAQVVPDGAVSLVLLAGGVGKRMGVSA
jgi:hypothetical protein